MRLGTKSFEAGLQDMIQICSNSPKVSQQHAKDSAKPAAQKSPKIWQWKSPKKWNFRFGGGARTSDVRIWSLDYFTMKEYKLLLANLKAWMAKSSIKEPLLWPTIPPSLNQKLSTEHESKQSTKTKIYLQAIFWKKKNPNVIIIKS